MPALDHAHGTAPDNDLDNDRDRDRDNDGDQAPAPALQLLRLDHAPALLAFEYENRAYFAVSVRDRGESYFARFAERLGDLLTEQAAGLHYFHVLVSGDGTTADEVIGRVNLVDVADGSAELGYRIAEKAAGKGLATEAVREVCALAAETYGLTTLRAAAHHDNAASRAVLEHAGFTATGESEIDGRPATHYIRTLS
ncbi:GNAT family N-acetyltransferase [Streptomyces sp. NBC_01498]|uniref:GNAT family N-acetyltransferase n=1 Tax=Streptomyces sp. NBC_01498 TaxID=2975870 RepID=UPI002E7BB019|nr:GNAT family N-acetyltransferase [Streptomyces sp. NBC_01498]WTL26125.1 GNAT family N-acetyltransferase [Streptomyces sp. NBC_01498]